MAAWPFSTWTPPTAHSSTATRSWPGYPACSRSVPGAGIRPSQTARTREWLREWADTPHVLQAAMLLIWLAVLALALLGNAGLADARRTIQTIGKDTAPSIIAAQSM